MAKIWKDNWAWWTYFVKLLLLSMLIPIIVILNNWDSFMATDLVNKLSFFALFVVSFFGFFMLLTHKLSAVTNRGILLGTVSRDDHIENPKMSLRKLFTWDEIKKINVYKKKCKRSFGISDFVSILEITTKSGKKFESYINNISGFYSSLKSMGKFSLVSKGSYSGPSTTDISIKSFKSPQYAQIIYRIILGILIIILAKVVLSRFFGGM